MHLSKIITSPMEINKCFTVNELVFLLCFNTVQNLCIVDLTAWFIKMLAFEIYSFIHYVNKYFSYFLTSGF